jgi:hypothetical protein
VASVLAVVVLTDEDDCSARNPELFDPSSPTYGGTDLNLRCWAHGDSALHPVDRYVEGLLPLRYHPSRLVFVPIAGVPVDLATPTDGATDWEALVGATPERDPRMVERVDPSMPSRLRPSCNAPGRGLAFPPVRLARVARELEARGAGVTVQSICQDSFRSAVDALVRRIAG